MEKQYDFATMPAGGRERGVRTPPNEGHQPLRGVLPTGRGKSLVLAKIASDAVTLWGGRVLLLAHVKELLEQNADKVRRLCPELKVGRLFRRIEL